MGKEKLPLITLRYTGLFDFDGLYSAIIDWAKNYGYMWHEKDYKHKVPSPSGSEQEWIWEMTKNVTDYLRHNIIFFVHSWDITEVEIEVEGKKKSLTNARLYIKIQPILEYDWQERFKGRFTKKLGEWYQKIWRKDFESVYGDQLYYRVWDLHAIMKKYFDMQTKKYAYKGYMKED